jgi:dTDP-4-amino-4,6-dideoxygalactose transaminase
MIPISKPWVGEEEKRLVMQVLDSGMLVQGPKVAELERLFAETCKVKHAVATSNGTTALHTALLAHGVGPGDEVITTPFTFIASVNSIIYTGARPVFVDILPDCFNIDPSKIEAAITPRSKAIIPVHLYGYPALMDQIMQIAHQYGLAVVEDAAQAVGARLNGQPTGSFGTGCFSLYATKNVMSAEGGMITTNDDEVAHRCRLIRAHGMERRYYHDMLGFNFRMSDLHAAIGIGQMHRLPEFTEKRRQNAEFLNKYIDHPAIITPSCALQNGHAVEHVWHQYTIRVTDGKRDEAVQKLTAAGIGTGIFYPIPAHRQKHIVEMGLGEVALPAAEQAAQEVVSLPVHPLLSSADLEEIVNAVNRL